MEAPKTTIRLSEAVWGSTQAAEPAPQELAVKEESKEESEGHKHVKTTSSSCCGPAKPEPAA